MGAVVEVFLIGLGMGAGIAGGATPFVFWWMRREALERAISQRVRQR